ncbi:hypothetical protein [Pseudomonas panipatensis]|uniref:DUF4136 domain-containing protein n=1 Tax=Pseudomonas panipatensis TaxID=428992 RepID=A0A1G8G8R8_9PSED|nr:hypothetical protein [Pseudomonas panipatensis]SDH90795.1 hypothetical protein SAMN05216272_10483 [Pseudomonas panipatensis]SMP44803.1 hypothetical protein SAMN06295951_101901 [Pseudomonas panipatensis]
MKLKMLGALFALSLAACASFPGDQVAPTKLPSMASYQQRPSVYVDFAFYQGEPGSQGAVEMPQAREQLKPQLETLLRESGLFSRYSLDQFQKQPGDYTLKLKVYNHGSSGAAMLSGIITGVSLFIIPGTARDDYTMTLQVIDPDGRPVLAQQNNESIRTWLGIWFLPLAAHTPKDATNDAFSRQFNALLKKLVDQQVLKYAQLPSPLRG